MATTFADSVEIDEVGPGLFKSRWDPEGNGSSMLGDTLAFGGTTLAIGLKAAHRTVSNGYTIYTACGYFMSPALISAPLEIQVTPLRDTRTFATRQISISQQMEDDQPRRVVLHMITDFHAKEERSLLEYGARPVSKYSSWEDSYTLDQIKDHAAKQLGGKVPEMLERIYDSSYQSTRKYFQTRLSPESVTAQTFAGFLPQLPTSQDGMKMTEKTQVNWFKPNHTLTTASDHFAALAYILDAGSSAIPPVLAKTDLSKIAAASSMDFAMRFFSSTPDLNGLHLREDRTIRAGEGRTYQEARVWSEDGILVANMTQQCILRPKSSRKRSNL